MERIALVTGSTSGIGLGVARCLAPKVNKLLLNGLASDEDVQLARDTVLKENNKLQVEFHGADLSKPSEIKEMMEFCKTKFGRSPDILVNNAGIQHVCPVESFPEEKWDQIIAVNLSAAFHTTKAVVPGMRERGWGRIINIASVHGLVASVNKTAYCASKFGIVGLTKVVALETAGSGVTCNAICPGFVYTPLTAPQFQAVADKEGIPLEAAVRQSVTKKQPSGQMAQPEDIGELVCYLCSPSASQVTGASLTIDGGWTAQ